MSNLVLYRKYRPQKFSEVISQEHVKTTLINAVKAGRVGHAYLFTGPRGVGKTTMARILSRAVNCTNLIDGEPCNQCDICKELLTSTGLDLMEIDAASHTGVDNIRELIDHLQFAPTHAKYKVIIIDEVHMLSKGAFNALLKTLEEPPKHAIFILATTEIHKVPPTIISRTQRFDFKKVSIVDSVKLIKYICDDNQVKITQEAMETIAAAADGGLRDVNSLLDQVISYSNGEVTETLVEEVLGLTGIKTIVEFLNYIFAKQTSESVKFISKLMYSGRDLFQFQKDLMEYLRKLMLVKVSGEADLDYPAEAKKAIEAQAQSVELSALMHVIELFTQAGSELKYSAIPSLPLEIAAVKATQDFQEPVPVARPRIAAVGTQTVAPIADQPAGESNPDSLNLIIKSWNQILEKVKEYNHSLISSLKLAQPVSVTDTELIMILPYKFHKDTIEARKNRIIIDQVIDEVVHIKIITKPLLAKEWSGEIPSAVAAETVEANDLDKNLMESALKIMGGEVEGK